MTVIAMGLSRVLPLPQEFKMRVNQTISLLGMLFTALYITLVKVVVMSRGAFALTRPCTRTEAYDGPVPVAS